MGEVMQNEGRDRKKLGRDRGRMQNEGRDRGECRRREERAPPLSWSNNDSDGAQHGALRWSKNSLSRAWAGPEPGLSRA